MRVFARRFCPVFLSGRVNRATFSPLDGLARDIFDILGRKLGHSACVLLFFAVNSASENVFFAFTASFCRFDVCHVHFFAHFAFFSCFEERVVRAAGLPGFAVFLEFRSVF